MHETLRRYKQFVQTFHFFCLALCVLCLLGCRKSWTDPSTGLMWESADNGKDITWHDASSYCSNLRKAGRFDWRLPTLSELRGIYDPSISTEGMGDYEGIKLHVKGGIKLSGYPWSSTREWGVPKGTQLRETGASFRAQVSTSILSERGFAPVFDDPGYATFSYLTGDGYWYLETQFARWDFQQSDPIRYQDYSDYSDSAKPLQEEGTDITKRLQHGVRVLCVRGGRP